MLLACLCVTDMIETRSGASSYPEACSEEEMKARLASCRIIRTECDFEALVKRALASESHRVWDEDDEDDLDEWELEGDEETELLVRAAFEGELSPAPSSRSSTPELPEVGEPKATGSDYGLDSAWFDGELSPAPSSRSNTPPLAQAGDTEGQDMPNGGGKKAGKKTRRGKRPAREQNAQAGNRTKNNAKRRKVEKKKADAEKTQDPRSYKAPPHALLHLKNLKIVETTFDVQGLPAAQGAYVGKRLPVGGVHPELTALLEKGYELFRWDGK